LTTDRSSDESALAAESQRFFERNEMSPENLADWLGRIGRDEEWFNQCCAMEVTFRRRTESLFGPGALQKELGSQRLTLTRFEVEVIELESRDAAQEALFCVREDGMSMEEVATECRYPYRRMEFLLEDMSEEVQQRFLSVTDGQILDPLPHGDGFELCRIVSRVEPKVDHPNVKARLEWRLISRHFSELASKHVERRLGAPTSTE
jgi:hypothetical protein